MLWEPGLRWHSVSVMLLLRDLVPAHTRLGITKLGRAPGDRDHRRVLAVLSYLATG